MSDFLALSAKFSRVPEPEEAMAPMGNASSTSSLRLDGAAFLYLFHSGLKATEEPYQHPSSLRRSAQRHWNGDAKQDMSGCFTRTLSVRRADKRELRRF